MPDPLHYALDLEAIDIQFEQGKTALKKFGILPLIAAPAFGLIVLITAFSAWFTVPEGHVSVVQEFGKTVRMEGPGFHWKKPWVSGVVELEVRERVDGGKLSAATANQLPTTAETTVNWMLNRDAVMETFIRYGSLEQFIQRQVLPKIRSSAKAAISRFPADQIIRDRQAVIAEILQEILKSTEGLPIQIFSVQLEDVKLPDRYMASVEAKEQAREDAIKEKHNLDKQKLQAQREVQSAEAERDALKARADGNAYKILTEAQAEAEKIALINEQLSRSPAYVDFVRAKSWNGVLPQTVLGDSSGVLFGMSGK